MIIRGTRNRICRMIRNLVKNHKVKWLNDNILEIKVNYECGYCEDFLAFSDNTLFTNNKTLFEPLCEKYGLTMED